MQLDAAMAKCNITLSGMVSEGWFMISKSANASEAAVGEIGFVVVFTMSFHYNGASCMGG